MKMSETDNQEERVSKTQMKKRMNDLQDLGLELTRLSNETLKKIGLPEDLYQAVRDYKKITSNGATKRQVQYIGRLMRETDPEPIRDFLAKMKGEHTAHNAFLQRIEYKRQALLDSDQELTAFISEYPHADAPALRTLIRNARKEKELNKPPKHFRSLYQAVKEVMAGPGSGAAGADNESEEDESE